MNNLQSSVAFDLCEDVEQFWIEDSGRTVWVVSLPAGLPGQQIAFDDLEFHIEEAITPDDMAQEIFVLAGGSLIEPGICSTSEHMCVHYDPQSPGQLALEEKIGSQMPDDTFWLPSIRCSESDEATLGGSRPSVAEESA